MTRRPLPGAEELFRQTAPAVPREPGSGQGVLDGFEALAPKKQNLAVPPRAQADPAVTPTKNRPARRRRVADPAPRPTSGRERHDEKITVYVSQAELLDLERARLVLRGEHGVEVDRGRIVREALATALDDLREHGDASILVRRLSAR